MDLTEQTVRALAAAAGLPLGAERAALVAPQLAGWLTAADELSRKMSAAEHWTVPPVTVFTHPDAPGGDE
jgi:hypothetical protein